MEEITDENSALAWLEGKPHEVQVAFAARAALRALPGIATDGAATLNRVALPVLRATLTSSVAALRPTDDVKTAARSALSAALSTRSTADSVAFSTALSALSAALSARSAALSAGSAALSAALSTARSAAWAAANLDAGNLSAQESPDLAFRNSLWPEAAIPTGVDGALAELQSFWAENQQTWDFWARWYAGTLAGTPLPWDVQEAVALIPDEDWETGPERVAERIRGIEAHLVANTLKEEVTVSPSGRLTLIATSVNRTAPLGQLLDTIEDALDLATSGLRNELPEHSHQVLILRQALRRYGNDAQRLEMDFERARALHVTDMAEGTLPSSAANRDLAQALADAAGAIRDSDPDIARNREKLNHIRLKQISGEEGQKIAAVAVEVANASEGTLREDLLEDRYHLPGVRREDGAPDPIVPIGASERNAGIEAADAQLRIASRLSRVWLYTLEHPGVSLGAAGSLASIIQLIIQLVL